MELDWPSPIRGAVRRDEARLVGDELGADHGDAYLLSGFVAECELADGRGGEPMHLAASELCDLLLHRAVG